MNDIRNIDIGAYERLGVGYEDVVSAIDGQSCVLLVGANTILDNVGSVTALEKMREAGDGIGAVVWAGNAEEETKLKALGVDRFAQVAVGLPAAMKAAGVSAQGKTVLIGSEADFAAVKDAAGVSDIDDYLVNTLKVKAVKRPSQMLATRWLTRCRWCLRGRWQVSWTIRGTRSSAQRRI
jgi:hypothetical protein